MQDQAKLEQQAKSIFLDVLDCDLDDRAEFVRQQCNDNEELQKRVTNLLEAFLDSSPSQEDADDVTTTIDNIKMDTFSQRISTHYAAGHRIGPYVLQESLGEGGFGVVYLATQTTPIERSVALKIIKPGMDTNEVVKRFKAERQTLALMEHPSIAKVFDAGATDEGRPFFVMEYVPGKQITTFADENKCSIEERLRLFIKVCQAIQHAHQKGVIHRDLKPTNIMVVEIDGVSQPKVIDFGISKAIDRGFLDHSAITTDAKMIGTPAFMSPEQASFRIIDIDIRTDVYSLGILLYELLTGRSPYDKKVLQELGLNELEEFIRERVPPRPSVRLTEVEELYLEAATERSTNPARLVNLVKGDLDWIVMKSIEKDRQLRYQTVNAFAEDVQRFLNIEPVEARPPGKFYRFKKFINKHRFIASTSFLLATVLVVAVVVSTYFAIKANRASTNSSIAQEDAEQNAYSAHMTAAALAIRDYDSREASRQLNLTPLDRRGAEWDFLQSQLDQSDLTLASNSSAPYDAVFSPDGTKIVTSWHFGKVRLHRCIDMKELSFIDSNQNDFRILAMAPDGNTVYCGSKTGYITGWDLRQPRTKFVLKGHTKLIFNLKISRDGKLLFSSSHDGTIRIWDLSNNNLIRTIPAHKGGTDFIAISPDGSRLASSGWDQTVRLWNVETGKLIAEHSPARKSTSRSGPVRFAAARITSLVISQNGDIVAAGTADGVVRVYNSNDLKEIANLVSRKSFVRWIAISPDSKNLAIARRANAISLWDLNTEQVCSTLLGHTDDVRCVAFTPDGKSLVSSARDFTIRLWDTETATPIDYLLGHYDSIWKILITDSGTLCASISADGKMKLWDIKKIFRNVHRHRSSSTHTMVIDKNHNWCLSSEGSTGLKLVDVSTGKTISFFEEVSSSILCVAISNDSKLCCAGLRNGKTVVWNIANGKILASLNGRSGSIETVIFDKKNSRIFSGSNQGKIQIWDLTSFKAIRSTKTDTGRIWGFDFDDSGNLVFMASEGKIRFFDFKHDLMIKSFEVEKGFWESQLKFSPDKTKIAYCATDRSIQILDSKTGKPLAKLIGHSDVVHDLVWLPDGTRLVSASRDKTVKIWNTKTGEHVGTLYGHRASVTNVEVGRDGRSIASSSEDGTIRFWHANPKK